MKPITTNDILEVIEYARINLELRKTKPEHPLVKSDKPLTMSDLDKIDRHLLSLIQLKRIMKMVRYYGGFEAIQDTLATAIQCKQPSLFEGKPKNYTSLEDLAYNRKS